MKCPRCMCGMYTAAYAKLIGHICPDNPAAPAKRGRSNQTGVSRADYLRDYRHEWHKARKNALAETGLCQICGEEPEPEKKHCRTCLDKMLSVMRSPTGRRAGRRPGISRESMAARSAYITQMYRDGHSMREISRWFGVAPAAITQILANERKRKTDGI